MARETHINDPRRRRGLTLLETVLSLLILGGAFVAALNTIASARASQSSAADRRLGLVLAEDLMAEILAQEDYRESNLVFGPESDERDGKRASFDDIDDYNGWKASPPVTSTGDSIAGTEAYTRAVTVGYVQSSNPAVSASGDQGLMQITVTVTRGSKTVAELVAFRSDLYESPAEGY